MTEDQVSSLIDDRTTQRIESAFDEMKKDITDAVHKQVSLSIEERVNGGVRKVQADSKQMRITLDEHTQILTDVKGLLEQEKFIKQLWSFIKFIGAIIMGIGGAILLYKELQ